MAAYGLDVLDPAAVTPRRLVVLLDQLGPAYRAPGEQWSAEAELLAVLVDAVQNLTYVTARAAGAKNVNRPRPIPRPGRGRATSAPRPSPRAVEPGERHYASWADAISALAGMPGVEVSRDDG